MRGTVAKRLRAEVRVYSKPTQATRYGMQIKNIGFKAEVKKLKKEYMKTEPLKKIDKNK